MRIVFILLLICSTATAQTTRVQSVTSGGILIYTKQGVDTGNAAIRNEIAQLRQLVTAQGNRIAALEKTVASIPQARQSTIDSLQRINPLLTAIGMRIDSLRSQFVTLNGTVSGNLADDRVQAAAIKSAQDAVNTTTAALEALKQYLKAIQ